MHVNELILDELLSKGYIPERQKSQLMKPNKNNVFNTLFFLMHNNVTRELVNKFYCIFIAGDPEFIAEETRQLYDEHKSLPYYDIKRKSNLTPLEFDIQNVYHIYTPFYCKEDESPGPIKCLAWDAPRLVLTRLGPYDEEVVRGPNGAVAKFRIGIYANHPNNEIQTQVIIIGATHMYDSVTDTHYLTAKDDATTMSFTLRAWNCHSGVSLPIEYSIIDEDFEPEEFGIFSLCEGEPPHNVPTNLANGFNGDDQDIMQNTTYCISKCNAPCEDIHLPDFIPSPFSGVELDWDSPGDLDLFVDPAIATCEMFDRYTIQSTYRPPLGAIQSNKHHFDFVGAVPQLIPYESLITATTQYPDGIAVASLAPANHSVTQPIQSIPNAYTNQFSPLWNIYNYWDHFFEYENDVIDENTGDPAHYRTYLIEFDESKYNLPRGSLQNITWPFLLFYKPKPEYSNACFTNEVTKANDFYAPTPPFAALPDYQIEVKKILGYVKPEDFLKSKHLYDPNFNETPDSNYEIMLELPHTSVMFKEVIQYHMKFIVNCAILDVLFTFTLRPPANIFNPGTRNNNNLLSFEPFVSHDLKIDYTPQYTFQTTSNIDGILTPQFFEQNMLSVGNHLLTHTATPLYPYHPSFTVEEPFNNTSPTFNICTPSVTGNLINKFREEYLNAPCKEEGDQLRADFGKDPFNWSDHLAYAALRHAYYLHMNSAPAAGAHYQDSSQPYYLGDDIGARVRRSNYSYISCGEGVHLNTPTFCDMYYSFKSEYTDDMDPNKAGHFGAWVKPKPTDPLYADNYVRDIGYARVGDVSVVVYGQPKNLAGEVPPIPTYITDSFPDVSNESANYTTDTYIYQVCMSHQSYPSIQHPVVEWKSDIDGFLSEDNILSANNTTLSPGTHNITATYILDGVRYQDSIQVTILPPCSLILPESTVNIQQQKLFYEQCNRTFNDYRQENFFPLVSMNDYLMYDALRHAYYLHVNNFPNDYAEGGLQDTSLPFSYEASPRERLTVLGYRATPTVHVAVILATNLCDAWYKIENDLLYGKPPLHHYDSLLFDNFGFACYGKWTVIYMASDPYSYIKPLVMEPIPSQVVEGSFSTYAYSFNDPNTGVTLSNLVWDSNVDGPLGTFSELNKTTAPLSIGVHEITASAVTSCGLASITFPVVIEPSFHIDVLASYDSYNITLRDDSSGDPYDGPVAWTSSLDGNIHGVTGPTLDDSTDPFQLESGTHLLTAVITVNGKIITVTNTASLEMDILRYVTLDAIVYNNVVLTATTTKQPHDLSLGVWYVDCLPTVYATGQNPISFPNVYPGYRIYTFVVDTGSRVFKKQIIRTNTKGLPGVNVPYKLSNSYGFLKGNLGGFLISDVEASANLFQLEHTDASTNVYLGTNTTAGQTYNCYLYNITLGKYVDLNTRALSDTAVSVKQGYQNMRHTLYEGTSTLRYRITTTNVTSTTAGSGYDEWTPITVLPFYDHLL